MLNSYLASICATDEPLFSWCKTFKRPNTTILGTKRAKKNAKNLQQYQNFMPNSYLASNCATDEPLFNWCKTFKRLNKTILGTNRAKLNSKNTSNIQISCRIHIWPVIVQQTDPSSTGAKRSND